MFNRLKSIIQAICITLAFFTITPDLFAASNHTSNVFTAIEKTGWFEQGNPDAPHQLYVIAEPNCSACHYLYESIRPYVDRGILKVRWIMVAFLKPSSLDKAAMIIASKNPAQTLENNESTFNVTTETGSVTSTSAVSARAKKIVLDNTKFMKPHGFHTTPIILLRSVSGKIEILRGAPQQNMWPKLLSYIGEYK